MTNWILLVLAAAAAAAGAAEKLALFSTRAPPIVFAIAAAVFVLLLILRLLPLKARRAAVFFLAFVGLVGLTGGLAYFHFVIKPPLIKGAIGAMFAAETDHGRCRGRRGSSPGRLSSRRSARCAPTRA